MTAMAQGPIRAVISRSAWQRNLARLRDAAPHAFMLAVIKANAYGHGAVEAARTLPADAYGVARLGEGLELRAAGITAPIVLMEGVFSPDELSLALEHRFDLVVHSMHQIDWLESVHPLTDRQLAAFAAISADIPGSRSVGNSAGIIRGPKTQGDWVRAGIALYGSSPTSERTASELGLEPVMSLESEVIALRDLEVGDSVGYGATWVAARRTRLAVIAAGYADGVPRSCPSGTPVLVAGHRVPLVGRVSMDMITVDVTDLPSVEIGDRVILWGSGLSVDEIAAHAGTIGYELLCRVTARVPRVYVD